MASGGDQPIMISAKTLTMTPDQPRPAANHRPQNHSAATARKATR